MIECGFCKREGHSAPAVIAVGYKDYPDTPRTPACVDCAATCKRNWNFLYAEEPLKEPTRWNQMEVD